MCVSNVTADVRREEVQAERLNFEDKSLKHQVMNSVCFRTKYEPKGHGDVSFIQRDHPHLLLTRVQNT